MDRETEQINSKIKTIIAIRNRLNSLTGAKEHTHPEYVTLREAKEHYEESFGDPVLIVSKVDSIPELCDSFLRKFFSSKKTLRGLTN